MLWKSSKESEGLVSNYAIPKQPTYASKQSYDNWAARRTTNQWSNLSGGQHETDSPVKWTGELLYWYYNDCFADRRCLEINAEAFLSKYTHVGLRQWMAIVLCNKIDKYNRNGVYKNNSKWINELWRFF